MTLYPYFYQDRGTRLMQLHRMFLKRLAMTAAVSDRVACTRGSVGIPRSGCLSRAPRRYPRVRRVSRVVVSKAVAPWFLEVFDPRRAARGDSTCRKIPGRQEKSVSVGETVALEASRKGEGAWAISKRGSFLFPRCTISKSHLQLPNINLQRHSGNEPSLSFFPPLRRRPGLRHFGTMVIMASTYTRRMQSADEWRGQG
ncbi:hypothetical protein VUR80DRAFT_10369 [Thermomyces stellatus]